MMYIIKCAKCRKKIFKYEKIGKRKLWHCWRDRIVEDYSIREGNKVKCQCGNIIGLDEKRWIKLKKHSYTHSGSAVTKRGKDDR